MSLDLRTTLTKLDKERDHLLSQAAQIGKVISNLTSLSGKSRKHKRSRKANLAVSRAQKKRWKEFRAAKKAKAKVGA